MSRIRMAATAATIACGLMLLGGTGVASAKVTSLKQTVPVTGSKGFSGKYTIDRFVAKGGKLYAIGTLKGKLRGKKVTKHNVRLPATLTGAGGASASQIPPIPNACQVLNLTLGPINLNLLGLSVRTNQIDLRIEAVPGAGNLLGNLLCAVTNLLNPAQNPLQQIAAALNAILALLTPAG